MADFVGLLRKTIEAQPQATVRLRQRIYERARATVERKLADGHASPEVIALQQAMLQQAIDEVEAYYSTVETQDMSPSPSAAMTSFSPEQGQDEDHFKPDTASRLTVPNRQEAPFAPSQFDDEVRQHADFHINPVPVVDEEADFVPFDANAFRRVERITQDKVPPLPPFEEGMRESPASLLQGGEVPNDEVSSAELRGEKAQSEKLRDDAPIRREIPSLASLLRENEAEQIRVSAAHTNNVPEGEIGQNPPDDATQNLAEELIPIAVTGDAPLPAREGEAVEQSEEKVTEQSVDVVGDVVAAQPTLPEVLESTPSLRETAHLQEELVASMPTLPPSSILAPAQEARVESVAPAFLDQIAVPETVVPQQMEEGAIPPVVAVVAAREDARQDHNRLTQEPSYTEEPARFEGATFLEESEFVEEKAQIRQGLDPIFPLAGAEPEAVSSSLLSPNTLYQDLSQEEVVAAPAAATPLVSLSQSLSTSLTSSSDALAAKPALSPRYESAENKTGLDAHSPPKSVPEMDMSWTGSSSSYATALQGDGKNESEMAKARRAIEAFQMASASPPAVASPTAQESTATSVPLVPPSAPAPAPMAAAKPIPDLKPASNLGAMPDLKSAPTLEAANVLDGPSDSNLLSEVTAAQTVSGNESIDSARGDPLMAADFSAVSDIFAPAVKGEKRKGAIKRVAAVAIGLVLVCVVGLVWLLMNHDLENHEQTAVGEQVEDLIEEDVSQAMPSAPKMTQRLLPGGRESDPGRAIDSAQTGGGVSPAVGGSVVDRHARVVYIESLDPSMPVIANEGQVEWSLSRTPSEFGGLDELGIVGTIDVPDRDMTVRLSIQRNTDVTIDAAYLFYFTFVTSQNPDGETIDAIRLLFKASEQSEGQALVGTIPVKVRENFFVLALRGSRQALEHNLALMRQLPFLRLNIIYADSEPERGAEDVTQDNNDLMAEDSEPEPDQAAGNADRRGRNFHIGEFSIAKDTYGDSVFKQAIDDWLVKANWAPLSPQPAPAPVASPSAPSPEVEQPSPDRAADSDLRAQETQPQE